MLILYGLGNNEKQFLQTKHNIGRLVIEDLAKSWNLNFQAKKTFSFVKTKFLQEDLYLVYSNGYMNESGGPLLDFYKYFKLIGREDSLLLILQDDSDQFSGNFKLSKAGGDGGHLGVKSIYQKIFNLSLDIEYCWRLKIGIRPAQNKSRSETFVLHRISSIEGQVVGLLSSKIKANLGLFLTRDLPKLQNLFNTKN